MSDIVEKILASLAEVPDFSVRINFSDRVYEVVNDATGAIIERFVDRDTAWRVRLRREAEAQAKGAIRAVLDAIAEPSEAMVREGRTVMCMNYSERMIYRVMLAALRKEIESD